MDPLTMHLARGASLFSGGALLVLAIGLSCLRRGRWATIARNLLAWLGLALVFGSATPYPLWVDGLILTFFLAWFLSEEEFAGHLAALLAAVVRPDRTVVMLELPLIPLSAGYGRAQRDLAAQHGVFLIPKRYFAAVLSAPGASLDGLHLSEAGTHLMADTLFPFLAPAFGR